MSSIKWSAVAVLVLLMGISGLVWLSFHYHAEYIQSDKDKQAAIALADSRQKTINTMSAQQQSVAKIDAKYTQELSDAKQTIADLQRDVADGTKRLHVSATCSSKRVSSTNSSTGVDDATSARLTESAQRNYFILRERIETATKQIAALQDYIRAIEASRQ